MTRDGFDVIGQEVFFDGWRVGTLRRDIPATVHDSVVNALQQREGHEKELADLRKEHAQDLEDAQAESDDEKLVVLTAKIATLRGIIHLMGGDLDS